MNNDTKKMFPSYDAIMERSGLTRPKVAAAQRELEQFYWITKRKRFSESTKYHLSYPTRLDKSQDILAPDQTAPTKEEAASWAKKIREERNLKDANRWRKAQEAIDRKRAAETEECNCDLYDCMKCSIPF